MNTPAYEVFPEKRDGQIVSRINVTKLIEDLTAMNVFPLPPDAADRATLADAVKALSSMAEMLAALKSNEHQLTERIEWLRKEANHGGHWEYLKAKWEECE